MDILDMASELPSLQRTPEVLDSSRGVSVAAQIPPDFVTRSVIEVQPRESPVVLVVAPAAVGKSTCARAMAAAAQCLLVDLAGQQVGDGTFVGLLLEALDQNAFIRTLEALRENRASVVIDALDEAHLRSGDLNFLAFIQGICRFARNSAGQGNVVLFSRMETADWIANTFEEEGVPLRQVQIDYFSEDESQQFIDVTLDALYARTGTVAVHRRNPGPYETARRALVDRVAEALGLDGPDYWETDDGKRFLGYAPVLETLSSYLCVPNHDVLAHEIDSNGVVRSVDTVREWAVLRSLCESLLEREHNKFVLNYWTTEHSALYPSVDQETLYTTYEQCMRLLARTESGQNVTNLPAHLPSDLRAEYSDKIRDAVANHPFLSTERDYVNEVFRDFVYAVALVDSSASEASGFVLDKLRSGERLPSPLVGPLIIDMLQNSEFATLDSDRCDVLLDSLQSYASRGSSLDYSIIDVGDDCFFELSAHSSDLRSDERLRLPLHRANTGLRLPARSRNLTVDFDRDVRLGVSNQAVYLGPAVSIRSGSIEVVGTEFVVNANDQDAPVVIESELILSTYPLQVRIFGTAFALIAGDVDGPLREFVTPPRTDLENEALRETFSALRKLLLYFRKTVHTRQGELAAHREFLDRNVLNTNPVAWELLGYLIRDEYAYVDGQNYVLRINRLSGEGINHLDIRSYTLTSELERFLARYATSL